MSVRSDSGYVDAAFLESTLIGNQASSNGGAVDLRQAYGEADIFLTKSTLSGNSVTNGDGGAVKSEGRAYVVESSIVGNTGGFAGYCSSTGGGIRTESDIYITNSYIGDNVACRAGGIYAGGNAYLYFSTLYNNTALGSGPYEASAVYTNAGLTARGSVVGTSTASSPLIVTPTIDDSYSISTSDDGDDSFLINLAPGSLGLGPLDDTLTAGQGGRSATTGSPLLQHAAPSALGTGVVFDQLGVDRRPYPTYTIGARQLAVAPPTPPTPPSPTPSYPPGAPTNVKATVGRGEATVTWSAPAYAGSYPITDYEVTSSPGAKSCLSKTTSCTVSGLTGGQSYTFTVRALNGAGWGLYSAPSNAVTPPAKSILITGSRDASDDRYVKVQGTTTDLAGMRVVPYVRFQGQAGATAGTGVRTVSEAGTFAWKRKTGKRIKVYFQHAEVRSNTVTISAR